MEPSLLPENPSNGGFPEPLASTSVCVVAVRHEACGTSTRVRLPSALPAQAVHRVRCARCQQAFEASQVDELGLETELGELEAALAASARARRTRLSLPSLTLPSLPSLSKLPSLPSLPKLPSLPSLSKKPSLPSLPSLPGFDPEGRGWRLLSVPLAAALVIGGLLLLQGGGDDPQSSARSPAPAAGAATNHSIPPATAGDPTSSNSAASVAAATGGASGNAELVRGSSYSLALPPDWQRTDAPTGATFAAIAPDGGADATLWITRDPKLDFPTFVAQSLTQLQTLAGSARIVERVPAPTEQGTIVRLAADAPAGEPTYEVTLRISGPYRYYLATSVQPDASPEAAQGAELVAGSFTPEAKG